jgi:hypothetical protein
VLDQLATTAALAVTTKGAEALAVSGKDGLAALIRLIRGRFRGSEPREAAILQAAMEHPDDDARRRELAVVLARMMVDDPVFRERLQTYWRAAEVEVADDRSTVTNRFSGTAEKVVQARDITGDVRL